MERRSRWRWVAACATRARADLFYRTPALINATFAATGKRIRALPIGKQLEA